MKEHRCPRCGRLLHRIDAFDMPYVEWRCIVMGCGFWLGVIDGGKLRG